MICKHCGSALDVRNISSPIWGGTKVFNKSAAVKTCPRCDAPGGPLTEEQWLAKYRASYERPVVHSLECRYCETKWPAQPTFFNCPRCMEPTQPAYSNPTISVAEAFAELPGLSFGWWLANKLLGVKRDDEPEAEAA